MLRIRPGSTPIGSSTSASPRPQFFMRPRTDYPLMGFENTRRLKRGATVRPFSVLMGLMPWLA